ncbi:hypothetical protein X975_12542, partial [Stegodyphus mimosarum]
MKLLPPKKNRSSQNTVIQHLMLVIPWIFHFLFKN